MGSSHLQFKQRTRALERKHQRLMEGAVTVMRADGLMEMRPRRIRRRSVLKPVVLLVLGFMAFKIFTLYAIGEATYQARVDLMSAGTPIEVAGGWLMQIDPLSAAAVTILHTGQL